ncbi:MAG: alpha/beta hydrolase, partial [Sneathiella sp.]
GVPGMKGLVSAVKDCLIAANVDRAHFVGHSMGALICQYLAADAPGLVSGMTLFGPLLEPPAAARQALKERAQTARNGGLTDIADSIFRGSVSEGQRVASAFVRESILRQDPNGYASHCEALSEAAAAAHQRITVPTLLIAGETDPVAPLAMVRQLQQDISLAQLEIVPQVAHWIMVEAPERSTQLLRAHLDTCHHK